MNVGFAMSANKARRVHNLNVVRSVNMNDSRPTSKSTTTATAGTRQMQNHASDDVRYMKYRSYTPKRIESKIVGHVKASSIGTDTGTTKGKSNRTRAAHVHVQNDNVQKKTRSSSIRKHVENVHRLDDRSPASVPTQPKNKSEKGRDPGDNENKSSESARPIHTDEVARARKHHNEHKTFDITTFPRVFSTSDLMDKMNEATGEIEKKCHWANTTVDPDVSVDATTTTTIVTSQLGECANSTTRYESDFPTYIASPSITVNATAETAQISSAHPTPYSPADTMIFDSWLQTGQFACSRQSTSCKGENRRRLFVALKHNFERDQATLSGRLQLAPAIATLVPHHAEHQRKPLDDSQPNEKNRTIAAAVQRLKLDFRVSNSKTGAGRLATRDTNAWLSENYNS